MLAGTGFTELQMERNPEKLEKGLPIENRTANSNHRPPTHYQISGQQTVGA